MTDTPTPGQPLSEADVSLLQPGDWLLDSARRICRFDHLMRPDYIWARIGQGSSCGGGAESFTFLGRPDQDGWIAWHGGENPVPGVKVECRLKGPGIPDLAPIASNHMDWSEDVPGGSKIIAYRPHVASPASSSSVVQGDANRECKACGAFKPDRDAACTFCGHAPVSRPGDGVEGWIEALDRLKMAAHVYEDDEMAADCATLDAALTAPAEPVSRPAGEGEREAVAILKGVGKIDGDGWKDTTTKGEVVYVWSAEKPSPYAPGQYPRIGNEGWSASTSQYDFTPATADDVPAILSLLSPAAPDAGGGWMPINDDTPHNEDILVCVSYNLDNTEWETLQWVDSFDEEAGWFTYPRLIEIPFPPTHWMPLPAPPALQPGGER